MHMPVVLVVVMMMVVGRDQLHPLDRRVEAGCEVIDWDLQVAIVV
jgi:hypothetical protein